MKFLQKYPSRVAGWIVILANNKSNDLCDDNGVAKTLSFAPNEWKCKFCVLSESTRALCLFETKEEADLYPDPENLLYSLLSSRTMGEFLSEWTIDSDGYDGRASISNDPFSENNASTKSKKGFFMNLLTKKTKKEDPDNDAKFSLKRSFSLGRLSRRRRASRLDLSPGGNNHDTTDFDKHAFLSSAVRSKSTDNLSPARRTRANSRPSRLPLHSHTLARTPAASESTSHVPSTSEISPRTSQDAVFSKSPPPSDHRHNHYSSSPQTSNRSSTSRHPSGPSTVPLSPPMSSSVFHFQSKSPTSPVQGASSVFNLPPATRVRPLHPSITEGRHGFQVTTPHAGIRRFFTESNANTKLWMAALRRTAKPNLENERHRENSLKLSIQEAKFLPPKRRYFCDVCLDRTLYARTTSKPVIQDVFWGEEFDLNNLSDISMLTINLYREAEMSKDGKKKKKKKHNQLVAYVTIPVSEVQQRTDVQRWFSMQPAGAGANGSVLSSSTPTSFLSGGVPITGSSTLPAGSSNTSGNRTTRQDVPQLRIKVRYQSIDILPIDMYQSLNNFAKENYFPLVNSLEVVLNVRYKEDIANCLVNILEKEGMAALFLTDIVEEVVQGLGNDSMAFRANSIATKAMECYLKLVGAKYLKDTLGEFIRGVLRSTDDCEVDPLKLANPGLLTKHQATLVNLVNAAWQKIATSQPTVPWELRRVFHMIRDRLEPQRGSDFVDRLISGCLFLRFICPALLSPCLFGLAQEFPEDDRVSRTLTLLAKVIQSLANDSLFAEKEPYMHFMNGAFLDSRMSQMTSFLRNISDRSDLMDSNDVRARGRLSAYHDYIDQGYELASLYGQLKENVDLMSNENLSGPLVLLPGILQDLTLCLTQPASHPPPSSLISRRALATTPAPTDMSSSSSSNPTIGGYLSGSSSCMTTPQLRHSGVIGDESAGDPWLKQTSIARSSLVKPTACSVMNRNSATTPRTTSGTVSTVQYGSLQTKRSSRPESNSSVNEREQKASWNNILAQADELAASLNSLDQPETFAPLSTTQMDSVIPVPRVERASLDLHIPSASQSSHHVTQALGSPTYSYNTTAPRISSVLPTPPPPSLDSLPLFSTSTSSTRDSGESRRYHHSSLPYSFDNGHAYSNRTSQTIGRDERNITMCPDSNPRPRVSRLSASGLPPPQVVDSRLPAPQYRGSSSQTSSAPRSPSPNPSWHTDSYSGKQGGVGLNNNVIITNSFEPMMSSGVSPSSSYNRFDKSNKPAPKESNTVINHRLSEAIFQLDEVSRMLNNDQLSPPTHYPSGHSTSGSSSSHTGSSSLLRHSPSPQPPSYSSQPSTYSGQYPIHPHTNIQLRQEDDDLNALLAQLRFVEEEMTRGQEQMNALSQTKERIYSHIRDLNRADDLLTCISDSTTNSSESPAPSSMKNTSYH